MIDIPAFWQGFPYCRRPETCRGTRSTGTGGGQERVTPQARRDLFWYSAGVLISSWPKVGRTGTETAWNGALHPKIGLADSLYLGIVLVMCPEIENPNPSRSEVAPRRTGHARRRPGQPEDAPTPSRIQNRPSAVCRAGAGHDHLVDREPGSTQCGRRDSPPRDGLRGTWSTEGVYRRNAPRHEQPIDDTRHCGGCEHAFRARVRDRSRLQSLPAEYDSGTALPAGRRRERLENRHGRVTDRVLALEARPAHPGRAGAAGRRRICFLAPGGD